MRSAPPRSSLRSAAPPSRPPAPSPTRATTSSSAEGGAASMNGTSRSGAVFLGEAGRFLPTEQARGPWDPRALHGGAPAALIARALEHHEPEPQMRFARLGFEFLRTMPFAPLRIETRTVRTGRRVQELAA